MNVRSSSFISQHGLWLFPLVIALLIAPFTPFLDLAISDFFFRHQIAGSPGQSPFGFSSNCIFDLLQKYGSLPAQLTGALSTLFVLFSLFSKTRQKLRALLLILSLTFLIGSGAISYVFFKEVWGRPRPYTIVQFGGKEQFRPFFKPELRCFDDFGKREDVSKRESLKSFPSGHATSGFYFTALYFVGKRAQRERFAKRGLLFGLLFGSLLSFVRLTQGGHFFSDVFFGGIIMWETAYFVDWFLYTYSPKKGLLKTTKDFLLL